MIQSMLVTVLHSEDPPIDKVEKHLEELEDWSEHIPNSLQVDDSDEEELRGGLGPKIVTLEDQVSKVFVTVITTGNTR